MNGFSVMQRGVIKWSSIFTEKNHILIIFANRAGRASWVSALAWQARVGLKLEKARCGTSWWCSGWDCMLPMQGPMLDPGQGTKSHLSQVSPGTTKSINIKQTNKQTNRGREEHGDLTEVRGWRLRLRKAGAAGGHTLEFPKTDSWGRDPRHMHRGPSLSRMASCVGRESATGLSEGWQAAARWTVLKTSQEAQTPLLSLGVLPPR